MQSQGAIALVCGILALATGLSNAFVVTPPLSRASFGVSASSGMTMKWDGQSMPKKNPKVRKEKQHFFGGAIQPK